MSGRRFRQGLALLLLLGIALAGMQFFSVEWNVYDLSGFDSVEEISFTIFYREDAAQNPETRSGILAAEDEGFQEVLALAEQLRFRRSIPIPILWLLENLSEPAPQVGFFTTHLELTDGGPSTLMLTLDSGSWSYSRVGPGAGGSYDVNGVHDQAVVDTLQERLWSLGQPGFLDSIAKS